MRWHGAQAELMRDEVAEHAAAGVLATWAARELAMREEAATDWPTHVQCGRGGRVVVQPDGREVVWPPELRGVPG